MTLKYFTSSNLEKYYGKNINEISPVDKPLNKYMTGHDVTNCKKCNKEINITCGYDTRIGSLDAFIDYAYCNNCDIEYVRERELIDEIDDVDYMYSMYRTDEREEYLCKHCHQKHPLTKPNGAFKTSDLKIKSHEFVTVTCKCGEVIHLNNVKFSDVIKCSNCSRKYEFNMLE